MYEKGGRERKRNRANLPSFIPSLIRLYRGGKKGEKKKKAYNHSLPRDNEKGKKEREYPSTRFTFSFLPSLEVEEKEGKDPPGHSREEKKKKGRRVLHRGHRAAL